MRGWLTSCEIAISEVRTAEIKVIKNAQSNMEILISVVWGVEVMIAKVDSNRLIDHFDASLLLTTRDSGLESLVSIAN